MSTATYYYNKANKYLVVIGGCRAGIATPVKDFENLPCPALFI